MIFASVTFLSNNNIVRSYLPIATTIPSLTIDKRNFRKMILILFFEYMYLVSVFDQVFCMPPSILCHIIFGNSGFSHFLHFWIWFSRKKIISFFSIEFEKRISLIFKSMRYFYKIASYIFSLITKNWCFKNSIKSCI